jgi:hypothetical protein
MIPRGASIKAPLGGACALDHALFLERNRVEPSHHGPVHTVETIYVPCGWCGTPVDPVQRVPVGRMFFHPHCLRCAICGKLCSRTMPFVARQGQPVCMNCDVNKSVTLPPLRASAYAERAKAAVAGVGTLRAALTERAATRSPTRRGLALELQQLTASRNDPNITLISSERQHEVDGAIAAQMRRQRAADAEAVAAGGVPQSLVGSTTTRPSIVGGRVIAPLQITARPAQAPEGEPAAARANAASARRASTRAAPTAPKPRPKPAPATQPVAAPVAAAVVAPV